MIEEEMYGMMPSAKTVSFSRAPPENMSNIPSSVPCAALKKEERAWASMPGVGM